MAAKESSLTTQMCSPGKAVNLWPRWRIASSWLEPLRLLGDESEISECTLACNHPEKSACRLQPEAGVASRTEEVWGIISLREESQSVGLVGKKRQTSVLISASCSKPGSYFPINSPSNLIVYILIENVSKMQEKNVLYFCLYLDVWTRIKLKQQDFMHKVSMDFRCKTKENSSHPLSTTTVSKTVT